MFWWLLARINKVTRLAKIIANSAPQISASKSNRLAARAGTSIWYLSSIMPDKVTISSGMENNGIEDLGVSLNDKAQTSKPKALKAKKCAVQTVHFAQ